MPKFIVKFLAFVALIVISNAYAGDMMYVCIDEKTNKKTIGDRPCGQMKTVKSLENVPKSSPANSNKSSSRLEDGCPQGALHDMCVSDMRARQRKIDSLDRDIEESKRQKERDLAEIRSRR
jgi:hypothetical protein